MKTKEDFANYTTEDFENLLRRIVENETEFEHYLVFDKSDRHDFEDDDDIYKNQRTYYNYEENTLYEITELDANLFRHGDAIYKNRRLELTIYPLNDIKNLANKMSDECEDYDSSEKDALPIRWRSIMFYRLLTEIIITESYRIENPNYKTRKDLPLSKIYSLKILLPR